MLIRVLLVLPVDPVEMEPTEGAFGGSLWVISIGAFTAALVDLMSAIVFWRTAVLLLLLFNRSEVVVGVLPRALLDRYLVSARELNFTIIIS